MRKRGIRSLIVLGFGGLSSACGSQATPEYRGEALFTLSGSVTIENESPPGNMVPALGFRDKKDAWHYVTRAEVTGEFPARFRLAVFERPAAPTILYDEDRHTEPSYAIGAIMAITAEHPDVVPSNDDSRIVNQSCDLGVCRKQEQWCTKDESSCFLRESDCDNNVENCQVVRETGDPSLLHQRAQYVAGLSRNYRVLYLTERAGEETLLAGIVNQGAAIEQGYHLLELRELTPQEQVDNEACFQAAADEALARFNEERGTHYPTWHDATQVEENADYQYRIRSTALARGCIFGGAHAKIVDPLASTPVRVTISPDVKAIRFD